MTDAAKAGARMGVLFGVFMGIFNAAMHGPVEGALMGLFCGVLFGLAMTWVVRRKERGWAKLRAPYEAEGIVHFGPANCAIGPGYMTLTKQRLVWLPLQESKRDKRIEIPVAAITHVRKAGGIGPHVHITVRGGESVEFLTRDRSRWIEKLRDVAGLEAP